MKRLLKYLKGTYLGLLLLLLYSPIAVMIVLSFNESKSRANFSWGGFKWYYELFTQSPEIIEALKLTLAVAVIATIVSIILGTLGAIGIHACKKGYAAMLMNLSYLPMTMPDIVTGVSLMLMFVFVNTYVYFPRGFVTMLIAHITFDTPYVLFSVMPKLKQMNPNTYEAALDLGCRPMKAIVKVILPEISPGIVTGGLLAFTMSLDDFVISFFTSESNNLSMLVYAAAKRGVEPTIYALSTLMFIAILILLIIINKRSDLESIS